MPTDLVENLRRMTDAATKTEAVVGAIEEEIRRRKLVRFRALAGKICLDKSVLKSRHHDHRFG